MKNDDRGRLLSAAATKTAMKNAASQPASSPASQSKRQAKQSKGKEERARTRGLWRAADSGGSSNDVDVDR